MKINGLRQLATSNTQNQNALNSAMSQWNASQQSPWDLLSQYSAIINGTGAPQMPAPPAAATGLTGILGNGADTANGPDGTERSNNRLIGRKAI